MLKTIGVRNQNASNTTKLTTQKSRQKEIINYVCAQTADVLTSPAIKDAQDFQKYKITENFQHFSIGLRQNNQNPR